MKCPVCSMEMEVMADDEMDAMSKMKEAGKGHMAEAHKEAPMMDEMEMEKMIKDNWMKM